jgi:mRNA interferase RelE/StbE
VIGYAFTNHAQAEFLKLPRPLQQRIIKKVEQFLSAPEPLVFAQRLTGVPGSCFRYRIGDYRVIFDWEGNGILITKVGHRRDVYR